MRRSKAGSTTFCGFTVCAEDLPDRGNRIALSDRVADSRRPARAEDCLSAFGQFPADPRFRHGSGRGGAAARGRERHDSRTRCAPKPASTLWERRGWATIQPIPSSIRWGRCHDVPNLFIADASVFVTSAAVNPDRDGAGAGAADGRSYPCNRLLRIIVPFRLGSYGGRTEHWHCHHHTYNSSLVIQVDTATVDDASARRCREVRRTKSRS